MGKEALPFDKDYILNILEDVFFYIKQGRNLFIYIKKSNLEEMILIMIDS